MSSDLEVPEPKVKKHVRKVERVRQRLLGNIQRGRSYALVLLLTLTSYFAIGIARDSEFQHLFIVILQGAVLYFTLRVSHSSPRAFKAGAVLWALMFLTVIGTALETSTYHDAAIGRFASASLFGFAIIVIGVNLARRKKVDSETTLGVISIYLLLGMFFAFLTMGIATLTDVPYFLSDFETATSPESEYLFFSFVTLTTVGYGNLVPATELGQTLASFEAICGTLFLILAIGRTISVMDAEKRAAEEHELRRELRDEMKRDWAELHSRLDAAGLPKATEAKGDPGADP